MKYQLKRVRTDDGRFYTLKLRESDPAELAAASPDEIWTCGDERKLLVKDMDTEHIANALQKMIEATRIKMARVGIFPSINDALPGSDAYERKSFEAVFPVLVQQRPIAAVMRRVLEERLNSAAAQIGRELEPEDDTPRRIIKPQD